MRVELKEGRHADVYVIFDWVQSRRRTFIRVFAKPKEADKEVEYQGWTVCNPPDNFCRSTGKKIAYRWLSKEMTLDGWAKEDKKEIFKAICPEYFTPAEDVETFDDLMDELDRLLLRLGLPKAVEGLKAGDVLACHLPVDYTVVETKDPDLVVQPPWYVRLWEGVASRWRRA